MTGRRTGVPTLIGLARQMCKYIVMFSPVIRSLYPNNTTLLLALETALSACGELEAQLAEVREIGD